MATGNATPSDLASNTKPKDTSNDGDLVTPKGTKDEDQTFIVHQERYIDSEGTQHTKNHRVKSEDFATVSAEQSW